MFKFIVAIFALVGVSHECCLKHKGSHGLFGLGILGRKCRNRHGHRNTHVHGHGHSHSHSHSHGHSHSSSHSHSHGHSHIHVHVHGHSLSPAHGCNNGCEFGFQTGDAIHSVGSFDPVQKY